MRTMLSGALFAPLAAAAHDGHAAGATHWHASDAFGFALALAALVAVVWWRRK